jgi:hypothetical protein
MFGVSEEELRGTGVDVDKFVRVHAREGVNNVYRSYEQRSTNSESLLPYWAPGAWIALGATKFARSWLGEVSLDQDCLRLDDGSKSLVEASPKRAHLRRVGIWFGMGVCIDLGSLGKWYVQPRYSTISIRRARKADAIFERALREAGAE